jgi:Xaa-Pro aminopeptidase
MLDVAAKVAKAIPFDTHHLDRLLAEAGIDVLVVTSKHNIQYLFGGYRFFFFDYMDAIGVSRYLPILVYRRGKPEDASYIGYRMEAFEKENGRFWTPLVQTTTSTSMDAARFAVEHIKRLGKGVRRIGVEVSFMPSDAAAVLQDGLEGYEFVDAQFPLERLRARKTAHELKLLRESSEHVVAAMLDTFRSCADGMTKNEIVETLRRNEVNRGLTFEYCLITAGTSQNRAPSDQQLKGGDILSLDSGGNYQGYIGDLCRMGILGEPDSELEDLLGFIEEVQQLARKPIKSGTRGGEIFAVADARVDQSPHKSYIEFLAHGMGLVSHEAPRLTSTGPVPYSAYDADRPLEAGMVVSIETTMKHPKRGFIKLEDTVAVTEHGYEGFGDKGRGWNRAGKV